MVEGERGGRWNGRGSRRIAALSRLTPLPQGESPRFAAWAWAFCRIESTVIEDGSVARAGGRDGGQFVQRQLGVVHHPQQHR